MTLIAGISCPDGFVICGDTEVNQGDIVIQGQKLVGTTVPSYQLVVGGAGDGNYLDQIKADILKAVAAVPAPSIDDVNRVLREEIRVLHEEFIFPQWSTNDPSRPQIQLIVGFLDVNKASRIWKTFELSVSPVAHYAFVGTGSVVAYHVAEKLLSQGQPTAVVHHMATQILLEAKTRASAVGGDTETWSVKNDLDSLPFYHSGADGKGYLWDLEGLLMSAIRASLETNQVRLDLKKRQIVGALDALMAAASSPFPSQDKQFRTLHIGRRDTHPFRDSSGI